MTKFESPYSHQYKPNRIRTPGNYGSIDQDSLLPHIQHQTTLEMARTRALHEKVLAYQISIQRDIQTDWVAEYAAQNLTSSLMQKGRL